MPQQQLHQAFLTFFTTLAPPAGATFKRPYLSKDGQRILYPQYETQDLELSEGPYLRDHYYFAPLALAVDAVYAASTRDNLTTPSSANLLLLMRFFNTIAISIAHDNARQLMKAPIYCMNIPDRPYTLHDTYEIAAYAFKYPNAPIVRYLTAAYLVPAHILFDAIQTLANAMNEINIDAFQQQNENFDFTLAQLKDLAGLPSINEQIALWQMLSPNPTLAHIFQAILTDPHVMWQMAGILCSLLLCTLDPTLDPRFLIAFNLAWETLGLWYFSQDNFSGLFFSAAYMGVLLLRAFITGLVQNPNLTPISSELCRHFTTEATTHICGHMLRGLNLVTLDRERLLMPPVMTWLTRRPFRLLPTLTPAQCDAQISTITQRINTLRLQSQARRNRHN